MSEPSIDLIVQDVITKQWNGGETSSWAYVALLAKIKTSSIW
jgi:hypothetical protein